MIDSFSGDLDVDARGAINPLRPTTREAAAGAVPEGANLARVLSPGSEAFTEDEAYDLLISRDLAQVRVSAADIRSALQANISDGRVGGVPVAQLGSAEARDRAYRVLADEGFVPASATAEQVSASLASHRFFDRYLDPCAVRTIRCQCLTGSWRTVQSNVLRNLVSASAA